MPAGRKKKIRCLTINPAEIVCQCFGPLELSCEELEKKTKVFLEADELQALIYQDIDKITMDHASTKMGISKTVYAGIYSSARHKLTKSIVDGSILMIRCTQ